MVCVCECVCVCTEQHVQDPQPTSGVLTCAAISLINGFTHRSSKGFRMRVVCVVTGSHFNLIQTGCVRKDRLIHVILRNESSIQRPLAS